MALSVAVVNSFARFAYALILPAMREDLAWSYTQAGSLNTINALGYLAGSYIAFRTVRRWGAEATVHCRALGDDGDRAASLG